MSSALIKLTNINKSFVGVHALKDVDLEIRQGEICCFAGENGSGKSTLIKVISGVYAPDSGQIEIGGKAYRKLSPREAIDHGIEVIYQDFSVFPNLTVAENVAINTEIMEKRKFVNWKQVYKLAEQALNKINVKMDLNRQVESLSVAERQLVAISRAICHDAKIIIMDEPTTSLTQNEVKSLFNVINELKKDGISVIFVSHKLDEVMQISERVFVFRNGEKVVEGGIEEFDKDKIIYHMTGRSIPNSSYRFEEKESGGLLLEAENLTQKGGFTDVSFTLRKGEILGITGLLGSGRTVLANALFGVNPVDSGTLKIEGKPVRLKSIRDAVALKLAYVPEDRLTEGLFLEQPVNKNTVVTVKDKIVGSLGLLDNRKINDLFEHWKKRLSIKAPDGNVPAKALSGGNQQKVVLSKWLATEPRILILNGPTVGVDIGAKTDILDLVKQLAGQGMGILLVSDDTSELLSGCNRILVMKNGRISAEIQSDSVTQQQLNDMIRGGNAY